MGFSSPPKEKLRSMEKSSLSPFLREKCTCHHFIEKINRVETSVNSIIAPKVSPVIPPIFLFMYLVRIRVIRNMAEIRMND